MNSATSQLNTVLACCDYVELDSSQKQIKGQLTASLCDIAGGEENFFGGCELKKKKKKAIINSLLPVQRGLSAGAPWSTCGGTLLGLRVSGVKACAAVDSIKVGSLI